MSDDTNDDPFQPPGDLPPSRELGVFEILSIGFTSMLAATVTFCVTFLATVVMATLPTGAWFNDELATLVGLPLMILATIGSVVVCFRQLFRESIANLAAKEERTDEDGWIVAQSASCIPDQLRLVRSRATA